RTVRARSSTACPTRTGRPSTRRRPPARRGRPSPRLASRTDTDVGVDITIPSTLADWNAAGSEYLPGHLGIEFLKVEPQEGGARLRVRKLLKAWNGFLHAGAVVTLADTCCGYGTVRALPAGAAGF